MVKNKLFLSLIVSIGMASAANVASAPINDTNAIESSTPVLYQESGSKTNASSVVLDKADQDAENLNALKRKLELEKIQADIQKAKNGGNKPTLSGQTTATSVIINNSGSKYATLQFIDGSTIDVELGSKIGKYVVSNIDLTGVSLRAGSCKRKKCHATLIKRSYPKLEGTSSSNSLVNGSSYNNGNPYLPTPIINNSQDTQITPGTQSVPPIVSNSYGN